jgi:hypothetical protein
LQHRHRFGVKGWRRNDNDLRIQALLDAELFKRRADLSIVTLLASLRFDLGATARCFPLLLCFTPLLHQRRS